MAFRMAPRCGRLRCLLCRRRPLLPANTMTMIAQKCPLGCIGTQRLVMGHGRSSVLNRLELTGLTSMHIACWTVC